MRKLVALLAAGASAAHRAVALSHSNVYVNVHTAKNPDGEIRGQLARG